MQTPKASQFKIMPDGLIYYQLDASNPLPGEAVARLKKGENALAPGFALIEGVSAVSEAMVEEWLKTHIESVLEPLAKLNETGDLAEPVKQIAAALHTHMGILPREALEEPIQKLDPAMRQALRQKQIRLGPVLAFMPALNKPAAIRLRAVLWSLYQGKPLPAPTPKDGMVSFRIDPDQADRAFYQAVGYPVYAARAIRIDMLDRVISAVYESAKDGKFQAKHQMAEWLGCGIEELYDILKAMGHTKIEAPSVTPAAAPAEQQAEPHAEPVAETPSETPAAEAAPDAAPKPVKPPLAVFYLRRGKAVVKRERPVHVKKAPEGQKSQRPGVLNKPKSDKPKFDKKKPHRKETARPRKDDRPRVISSAGPERKLEDSPFAILQSLKTGK